MKISRNQAGFSTIEIILVVVVAGLLGLVGWFVYDRQKKDDTVTQTKTISTFEECVAAGNPIMESYPEQCAAGGKTFTKKVDAVAAPTDETSGWLLYEPPGKEYSMRLADGWGLIRCDKSPSLYTYDNDKLLFLAGQKAVVSEITCGSDGRTGLFINHATQNIEQIVTPGAKQTSLKTVDGLEIEKYYWVVTGYADEGLGTMNGDTEYTYVVRESAKRVMTVSYSFQPGATDHHELVEKVIRTIQFK